MLDPARLTQLFDAHAAQLVLYARQWLAGAEAEDVVQEVYVRLMLQSAEPLNPRAWLFKAVRNEAVTQNRSALRRRRREQAQTREEWFEAAVDEALDGAAARDALQALAPLQRETIVLRVWGRMTLKEIAAVTGLSLTSAFEQYRAGLVALRQKMDVPCQTQNR